MNRKKLLIVLLCLFITAISCSKNKVAEPGSNNSRRNIRDTLPLHFDFVEQPVPRTKLKTINGVDFSFSQSIYVFIGPGTQEDIWRNCVGTGKDTIDASPYWKGIRVDGVLIADISKLPEIHKITIEMLNGSSTTQISVCDGNNVIVDLRPREKEAALYTYTLDMGGKKGSKLYIYSMGVFVYSIHIE